MKFALLLSGQPRSYDIAFEYLKKNFLDVCDVDVFFHAWKNDVYSEQDIMSTYDAVSYSFESISEDIVRLVDSLYPNTPDPSRWPASATYHSFKSIYRVRELLNKYSFSKKIKYDYVMRTRFDFALNIPIPELVSDIEDITDNMIIVPNDRGSDRPYFCNDQWAFGTHNAVSKYCNTFVDLPRFYNAGVSMIGEDMLAANLRNQQMQLALINMHHPFPPGPYNGSYHSLVRDDMELWKPK